MKIGVQSLYSVYNKENNIFDAASYTIGANLEYPMVLLREQLIKKGFSIDTLDIYPIKEYKKIIFFDYPNLSENKLQEFVDLGIELYLVLLESELIYPKNFDRNNHVLFKKIFTWADNLVDNKKYFKLNLCNKIPVSLCVNLKNKNKFCTNISGNKTSRETNELYSERLEVINWFEKNHPSQFDLYGFDWDNYTFVFPFGRLNRFSFFRKLFGKKYSTYRGSIKDKIHTLEQYKFSICYENIKGNNGYVSEKIFDCFFAGTIPVYLGDDNVENRIPSNIFIDRRDFRTNEELYEYMNTMSSEEYRCYIKAIENYINNKEIYPFSAECFANVIIKHIC